MESQPDTPVDPLDTSRARDAIFARIRNAQHRPAQPTQGERDAVADYLARHPAGPRPPVQENLAAHFAEQALKMASTLDTVEALSDVPGQQGFLPGGCGRDSGLRGQPGLWVRYQRHDERSKVGFDLWWSRPLFPPFHFGICHELTLKKQLHFASSCVR